jgi:hypothetical protein
MPLQFDSSRIFLRFFLLVCATCTIFGGSMSSRTEGCFETLDVEIVDTDTSGVSWPQDVAVKRHVKMAANSRCDSRNITSSLEKSSNKATDSILHRKVHWFLTAPNRKCPAQRADLWWPLKPIAPLAPHRTHFPQNAPNVPSSISYRSFRNCSSLHPTCFKSFLSKLRFRSPECIGTDATIVPVTGLL